MALPFFLIGHYLNKYKLFEWKDNLPSFFLITFISGWVVYLVLISNGAAQMNGPFYGKNVLLYYIGSLSGCIMLFMVAKMLSKMFGKIDYVKIISRNTLFIIFSHWILLWLIGRFFIKGLKLIEVGSCELIVASFVLSSFVLCLSKIMIDYGVGRYPILFGK